MSRVAKVRGVSPEIDQIQTRMDDGIARAVPAWIADGRELDEVELAAGGFTNVKHGLGRVPSGWLFLRFRTGAALTAPITENLADKFVIRFLNTNAGSVRIKLWVY